MSFLAKMRVATRMNLVVMVLLAGLLLVGGGGIVALQGSMNADRADRTRQLVESALGVVQAEYARVQAGQTDIQTAQREAAQILSVMRYDDGNYFWINDFHARLIMHPLRPELVGRNLTDFRDTGGLAIFAEFARIGREKGGGFLVYQWPKPGYEAPVSKLSYVAAFPPWGWVIGSGSYAEDAQALFRHTAVRFAALAGLGCLASVLLVWSVVHGLSRPLTRLAAASVRVAAGEKDVAVHGGERQDELGELARALRTLESRNNDLATLRSSYGAEQEDSRVQGRRREALMTLLLRCSGDGILTIDANGLCLSANRTALDLLGCDDEADLVGWDLAAKVLHSRADGHPVERQDCRLLEVLQGVEVEAEDEVFWRIERSCFPVQYHAAPLQDDEGTVGGAVIVFQDIAERRRLEETMRLVRTVFNTTSEAIIVCDHENRITSVNPAFSRITGYSPQDVLGKDPKVLESGRHDHDFYAAMWHSLREQGMWEGEIWNRHKNGEICPQWLSIAAIRDHAHAIVEYVAVFNDATLRKHEEEERLRHAQFDDLTGLPNRRHFQDGLEQGLLRLRASRAFAALILVDFREFTRINATFGPSVGDRILQMAAKRLRRLVRETDLVGRVGGAAFMLFLEDVGSRDSAGAILRKVRESLEQTFQVDRQDIHLSVSAAMVCFPEDAQDAEPLMALVQAVLEDSGSNGETSTVVDVSN